MFDVWVCGPCVALSNKINCCVCVCVWVCERFYLVCASSALTMSYGKKFGCVCASVPQKRRKIHFKRKEISGCAKQVDSTGDLSQTSLFVSVRLFFCSRRTIEFTKEAKIRTKCTTTYSINTAKNSFDVEFCLVEHRNCCIELTVLFSCVRILSNCL